MEEIQRQITNNVTTLRKRNKDKQVDLAAILDVDRSFIAAVESHRRAYNIIHLNKIALHYKCTLHDLIPKMPIE